MSGRQPPGKWRQHLSDLILGGALDEASLADVVDAGLAGYAIHRIAEVEGAEKRSRQVSSTDQRLQRGKLVASVRHAAVRRVMVELVAAWRAAGIETLLYKGFMLAEFVYPDPTWRQYSDVDLALRGAAGVEPRALAAKAAEVAAEVGWEVIWHLGEAATIDSHHDPDYSGHELLLLQHAVTGVNVDAHRRLVHSNLNTGRQTGKGEAITQRVWAAASKSELDDAEVWLPAPVDSALVGLIAGRSWSGDRYELRPHDLLDLQALMQAGSLDHGQLLARAQQHGMVRTTRSFLRRCDPSTGTLDLRAPNDLEVFAYDTLLMTERGHRGLQRFGRDLAGFPSLVYETVRELLPALRPGGAAPLEAQGTPRHLDRRTWRRSQVAVRRVLRLLGSSPERARRQAVELLHASLQRRGYLVQLVERKGRIWLEHGGRTLPLDLLGEQDEAGARGDLPGWAATGPGASAAMAMAPWRRIARLGWRGVALRLEALVQLLDIRRQLRSKTFKEVRAAVVGPVSGRAVAPEPAVASLEARRSREIGEAVESAARFVPGAQCLAQSLGAQVMLARRGRPSIIHFGFLRSTLSGEVEGHAWLEADGQIVTGDVGLENFTRTATFAVPEPRRTA